VHGAPSPNPEGFYGFAAGYSGILRAEGGSLLGIGAFTRRLEGRNTRVEC
jgi:hypothetical protein